MQFSQTHARHSQAAAHQLDDSHLQSRTREARRIVRSSLKARPQDP